MATKHPLARVKDRSLLGKDWTEDFVKKSYDRVLGDWNDMEGKLAAWAHFYARRYGLLWRNPQFPWKDSSNIVPPVIDKFITQLKTNYYQLDFGRHDYIACQGLDAAGEQNSGNMALYLNSILQGHSLKYAQQDFFEQDSQIIEDLLQHGRGIFCADYNYRSESVWRTLHKTELPGILGKISVSPDLTEQERLLVQQEAEQNGGFTTLFGHKTPTLLNPPDVLAAFGEPVNPMTSEVFSRHRATVKKLVVDAYHLDEDNKLDRKACGEIVDWLATGTPEMQKDVKFRACINSAPVLRAVSPGRLIVPRGVNDLGMSHRLAEIVEVNDKVLAQYAEDNLWDEDVVAEIIERGTGDDEDFLIPSALQSETEMRYDGNAMAYRGPGDNLSDDKVFKFLVIWQRADVDNDGRPELTRLVMHTGSKKAVCFSENPFDNFSCIPYVDSRFERTDGDYRASRGVPEIISDYEKFIVATKRASLNSKLIQTSTGFFVSRDSGLSSDSFQWAPNMIVAVDGAASNAAQPILVPQTSIAWEREEHSLQVEIQSHIGDISNDMTADARLLEPRTKTEIDSRDAARRRVQSMRGHNHIAAKQKAFRLLMLIAKQCAPEEFFVQVTGGTQREMKRVSINGEFDVVPLATVADMDPDYRAQKAQQHLMALVQALPLLQNDPTYSPRVPQAVKEFFDASDILYSRRILPESTAQERQAFAQQAQAQAQQTALISEMAQRALANAGNTPEEAMLMLKKMLEFMPHKELQAIISEDALAQRRQEAVASLMQRQQMAAANGH